MKLGKRRKDDDPAGEPSAAAAADVPSGGATETWTAPIADRAAEYAPAASEPPVDSDAVELPPAPAPVSEPVAPVPPVPPAPLTISEPARPASAAASARIAHPPPVITDPAIAMGGATPADGHAPADPLMDEIRVLAAERPEIVVGAAFAGGILAAMILRRLGN
ncbi:MAG: hypothetical protein QOE31_882 [Solirubrobacteraceae bacterium]|nr:hypothetical protein [Solirubrobacteraceae bacterium]